ncbi:hypothetical protein NCAST_05_04830 [Nocardia asteroides NBRC 15531]|uniref:Uncharacterized protein n=1 Tax=Nocardia asteroides NBRC 15531 TaxID=1110697 RepID=U5E6V3_NOCAS|nr:hypothetical protein NCAST_05_04830 [Nocardia asteroides NBRC 15531]
MSHWYTGYDATLSRQAAERSGTASSNGRREDSSARGLRPTEVPAGTEPTASAGSRAQPSAVISDRTTSAALP